MPNSMLSTLALASLLIPAAFASPGDDTKGCGGEKTVTVVQNNNVGASEKTVTVTVNNELTTAAATCEPRTFTVTYVPTVTITVPPYYKTNETSLTTTTTSPSSFAAALTTSSSTTVTTKSSTTITTVTSISSTTSTASTSSTPAAAPAPASAPAPAPNPTSFAGSKTKRGVLAPGGNDDEWLIAGFNKYAQAKISWMVTWYSGEIGGIDPRIDFVPQLYGPEDNQGDFQNNAKLAIGKGQKTWLSYGEPSDRYTPEQAVKYWMAELQPYAKQGIRIGAPSVVQPKIDIDWLSSFLDLCEAAGCDISFIAIHFFDHVYGGDTAVGALQTTINEAVALAKGKPVWLDNFQANGTEADVRTFLSQVLPYLDAHPQVERYSYVSPLRGETWGACFLNPDGSLSDLGKYYATF